MFAATRQPATWCFRGVPVTGPTSSNPSIANGTTRQFTLIATYIGLEEPGGGPNWARFSDHAALSALLTRDPESIQRPARTKTPRPAILL